MRRVLIALGTHRCFGGVQRDAAAPAKVEQRASQRDAVLVDRRRGLAHGGEALGQAEAEQGMVADLGAGRLELPQPRSPALHDVERFGEEERAQRRVGALDGLADAPQVFDGPPGLVRGARAPQAILERPGQKLRRGPLRRRLGGAHGPLLRPVGIACPRRRLRRFEQQFAPREGVDGVPHGQRLERVAEGLVVPEPPRHLDAELERGVVGRPVRRDPRRVLQRCGGVSRSQRRPTRAELELVAAHRVGLERGGSLP